MKAFISILALFLMSLLNFGNNLIAQEKFLTDERDTKEYRIITIGNQVWMAENLDFESDNSWAYDDKKKNSHQYGRLYSWEAAQSACPPGWHLPSAKEWQELIDFYGGDLMAGSALRIDGTSAFNADYAGFRTKDGEYLDLGHDVNFWTATNCDEEDAWRCYIDRGFNSVVQDYFSKNGGLSVRCIKGYRSKDDVADKNKSGNK